MPDSDNILIEIKSAFDKSGTDQAERAQDRLSSKTKDLNRSLQDNEKDTQRARQALGGLTAASQASQGSFSGLSRVLEGFSGRLADLAGKATLVAGAFSAGYGIGTAIDKWLGLSKAVADAYAPAEKFVSIQDRIRTQLNDLNATSLANVKKEFDQLSETLNTTVAQLNQVNAVKNQLMGQETEAQLAELEASMPPGPARDRALLDARRGREQTSINARRTQESEKLKALQKVYDLAEYDVEKLEQNVDNARFAENITRSNKDVSMEEKVADRIKREAAEVELAAAKERFDKIKENQSTLTESSRAVFKGLALEERTSSARYSSGVNALDLRAREEAQRLAARRQGIREGISSDLSGISSAATRSALESQLGDLSSRADTLRTQGLPAARVQDLRSKASGASKQADSAVAAVSAVLDSITARMRTLEDKLKNLPR